MHFIGKVRHALQDVFAWVARKGVLGVPEQSDDWSTVAPARANKFSDDFAEKFSLVYNQKKGTEVQKEADRLRVAHQQPRL